MSNGTPSTSYFNEIDTTWTLVKSNWVPFTSSGGSGSTSLPTLGSLLSSGGTYLCLSLSQHGTDVGSSINSHWVIQSSLSIDFDASDKSDTFLSNPVLSDSPHSSTPGANDLGRFAGDQITISGSLTSANVGLPDQTVKIYAYNGTDGSSTLVNTTTTNSNGET